MPHTNIPPQSHYFYRNGWSKKMDKFLIDVLVYRKKHLKWKGCDIPMHALTATLRDVNFCYKFEVSLEGLCSQIELLMKRHNTFKLVVGKARWYYGDEFVTVTDDIWAQIFELDDFAKAYYHRAEPNFENLCFLFGNDDEMKVEADNVVVISETTPDNKATSEEVTQPIPQCVRRRSFNSENDNSAVPSYDVVCDVASSTHGGLTLPGLNAFPRRYEDNNEENPINLSSSSCASSNPPFGLK